MATPNIVPRADQEGGLGTSAKSWGKLFIENPTSGGTAAATISNLDEDQIALDINAFNTTANVIDISTTKLSTGRAINLDITDEITTSETKVLMEIDYDKTGNLQASQVKQVTALNIDMADTGTNDGASSPIMKGGVITLNNSSNAGNVFQTGLQISCTGGDTSVATNTVGLLLITEDGGIDLSIRSSADAGDKFTIATSAAGSTTISTIDDDGTAANLALDIDGNLAIDNAGGDTLFYKNGNTDDFLRLRITDSGGADFTTVDAAGTGADITFTADGKTKALIGSGSTTNTFAVQTTTASNPAFEFFGEDGNTSKLRIYEKAGATTDDYCEIQVVDRGVTSISTVDGAGSQRALLQLSPDGDLIFTDVTGNNSNDVVREVKMGTGFVTIVAEVDIFDANTTDHGVIKQIGTVQIPQFARIKSATIIVEELSNLATFNFELGLGTNTGVSAGTAPANYQALLASDKNFSYGTDSVTGNVGPNIGSGSGNLKKQFFSGRGGEDVLQTNGELSADSYLYIVSEGTSNGTTDATAGRVLVYVDYYGRF